MPTATATINGAVIASSNNYQTVEGNIYFPPDSFVDRSILSSSNSHTTCPWKGKASYYNINVDGGKTTLKDAAWYYPAPKDKASHIKDHVAFCRSPSPARLIEGARFSLEKKGC